MWVRGDHKPSFHIIKYGTILKKDDQEDDSHNMFRAITNNHGQLKNSDLNYNVSLYNVMFEWETGEITEEPLSIIAQDDPVTCAAYTKEHKLLHLPG